jgi:hypothetical protein
MKTTILLLIALLQITFFSCTKDGTCHSSNGSIVSENRETTGIDSIRVFNNIDVIIHKGANYKIEVEAPENLLPFIETAVVGRKLIIKNNNTCNFIRKKPEIKVFVTVPALATLEQFGIGTISSTTPIKSSYFSIYNYTMGDTDISLETDFVYVHLKGGGNVTLNGKADKFKILCSGTGFLYADEFKTKDIEMTSNSAGDVHVNGEKNLQIRLNGAGDAYFKGFPLILDTISTGVGRIIQKTN